MKDFVIDLRDLKRCQAKIGGEEENESEGAWMSKKSGSGGGGLRRRAGRYETHQQRYIGCAFLYSCAEALVMADTGSSLTIGMVEGSK